MQRTTVSIYVSNYNHNNGELDTKFKLKVFLLKYFKTVNLVIGYHNHLNLFIPKQIKESGFNRHT